MNERDRPIRPGRFERAARWLGLTEGQAYTVGLLAIAAALLLSSLTGLTGRLDDVFAAPPSRSPAVEVPSAAPTTTPLVPLPLAPGRDLGPLAVPLTSTTVPQPPAEPIVAEDPPPAAPCPADPVIASVRELVADLDKLVGGTLPDATVVSALAVATGCSRTDPAILLLAGLIEIGQGLPDLGLGALELPALPFLTLPPAIVELVQPLRPVLDPVCGTVASLTVITSQVGPHYPPPFDAVFAVSLFYALTTCGQIQA